MFGGSEAILGSKDAARKGLVPEGLGLDWRPGRLGREGVPAAMAGHYALEAACGSLRRVQSAT